MLKETVGDVFFPALLHLKSQKLLLAVSGGSDSMALLYLCSAMPDLNFEVATVDHGLRAEAADEALFVAEHCAKLNIPHITLNWRPVDATSQSARLARYDLLAGHAGEIGAGGIVLGHTLDDQAETLIMRAQRLRDDSSTRGLSGMPEIAAYGEVKLLRPLLTERREQLRDYLRDKKLAWIDDPSNAQTTYERVRVRKALQNDRTLPSIEQIGRLAQLSGGHRQWLAAHVSDHIKKFVSFDGYDLSLTYTEDTPDALITEIFLLLILAQGGRDFRVAERKILDIVLAFQENIKTRKAVGNCLIVTTGDAVIFTKETRKPKLSLPFSTETKVANTPDKAVKANIKPCPVGALEYFRPSSDDSIYEAISHIRLPERR